MESWLDTVLWPVIETVAVITGLVYSIVLHEIAHGAAALLFGDTTARDAGRLTLNPLPHIDAAGSVVIPAISYIFTRGAFGWAKPVPVNPSRFRYYRAGSITVSAAGVAVNLLLCLILLLLTSLTGSGILYRLAGLNFGLVYLNLLPLPPLDGFHILVHALPRAAGDRLENLVKGRETVLIGVFFIIMMTPPLNRLVFAPVQPLFTALARLVLGVSV